MENTDFGDVADVTNSTAFLSLNNLMEEGLITQERAHTLQQHYKQLHDKILQIYSNDGYLIKKGRQLKKSLETEKQHVEKCGETAKEDDATIQQLKKELAVSETDLAVAQERESMFQVETIELERKKLTLQEEVDTTVAEEESRMKPRMEMLMKTITMLREDIEQTADQFLKMKALREESISKDNTTKETMEKNDKLLYQHKLELTKLTNEPDRACKQAEIVHKAHQTASKENQALKDKLQNQISLIQELEEKRRHMEDQRYDLAVKLEFQRTAIEQREKLMENIEAHLDAAHAEGQQHQLQQSTLDLDLREKNSMLSSLREQIARLVKEKDQGLRLCKRIEQTKNELANEREINRKQKDILLRECQHIRTIRNKWEVELEELKRDVDILINNYLKEEMVEKNASSDLVKLNKKIKKLDLQVAEMHEQEVELNRKASDLGILRENRSREASKNLAKVTAAKDELKVKIVVIKELQKRNAELKTRLDQITEMYSVVKRERSNKAAMIQSASQSMSETQEKIKILENELEVLRRESQNKDKELIKIRRELHDEKTNCENLRVESNKKSNEYKQKKKQIEEQRSQILKLNTVINLTEEEMLSLKRKYEEAVENRNFTGIQLIDRNDELCILYEKANIQENILKKGQVMLKQREEEIRKVSIELADLQREIDICQKLLPKVRDLEEDLEQLNSLIEDERWRSECLERAIVSPTNAARWRKLSTVAKGKKKVFVTPAGSEPPTCTLTRDQKSKGEEPAIGFVSATGETPEELAAKEQQLEHKLAEANEKLMEKDLILEEVTELSSRLRKQATNGKEYTLALAKKMNAYQHTIKQRTKKMMATLSELSMVQATSIKLEMDVQQEEDRLTTAKERVELGLAPTATIEEEYERSEYDRRRRAEMLSSRQTVLAQAQNEPAVVTRTTAEQRPNAYIPDGDLMIPKPYGAHAPLKPTSEARNAHRFYKKPVVQEISFD
eukprot:TRINITY_DN29915_c0_g1_i1.p1 TRINITY_DN29915_c0_g1~~TRINITY_DN29915_c0_g1_i1.p1  ORF type:complete len:968 (+),score=513.92 TRINITY_DN29915_c0_g1_i1:108-3011(+)